MGSATALLALVCVACVACVACAVQADSGAASVVTCTRRSAADVQCTGRVLAVSDLLVSSSALQDSGAWAHINDSTSSTGWVRLTVLTNRLRSDVDQAYAAGYAEAMLSCTPTRNYFDNYIANEFGGKRPGAVYAFLHQQLLWMSAQVQANPSDPYWGQVGLVLQQFRGLVAGHTEHCDNALALDDLLLLNAAGDVETLATLFKAQGVLVDARAALSRRPASREYPVPQALLETDCSALVRVLPDFSNLFATQATWRGYFAMLRSYKFYLYGVDPQAWLAARGRVSPSDAKYSVSFSSQPAFLSSKDDFYITSHGLVTMETTNDVFNQSLYVYVVPSTVPCWVRSIVANRVGVDGDTWTSTFARYNSGTYNNQWMVVDYNRFVPGAKDASSALLDGALWLAEQIPGYVERADVTDVLRQQLYWPSYNIPYFASIYNASGYPEMNAKYPTDGQFSYTGCPRARIFARNITAVTSGGDVHRLIRYNNWQHDPISDNYAGNAVASRYDLNPASPSAFGAIDAKMTCAFMRGELVASAISGPTSDQQPVFDWNDKFSKVVRTGVPDRFDFPWTEMSSF